MQWKQLTEAVGYTDVDETIIDQYKDIIKKYADNDRVIYRGMKGSSLFIVGDGSMMNRVSKNTSNFYTMMIDNFLPSWETYPKRSKSFICTTSKWIANSYGKYYVVIPLEGQEIGVCPEDDFWYSFPIVKSFGMVTMDVFNDRFEDWCFRLGVKFDTSTISSTKAMIEELDEQIQKNPELIKNDFYQILVSKGIIDTLNMVLNPSKNGFVLTTDIPSITNREVWMSGKVLFISANIWDEVKERLK